MDDDREPEADHGSGPRGPVSRSLIAAGLFAVAVVPGWTLGALAERWTGWGLLDWCVTCAGIGASARVLAPRVSYRARDGWLGALPLTGWYLVCVLCWRVALLPYRDWEPRPEELWRARWLTGDGVGLWRADLPARRRTVIGVGGVRGPSGPAVSRRSR